MHRCAPAFLVLQMDSYTTLPIQKTIQLFQILSEIVWKLEMALQAIVIIVMQNTEITWVCFTELLAEENYWQKNHRQVICYMDIHR